MFGSIGGLKKKNRKVSSADSGSDHHDDLAKTRKGASILAFRTITTMLSNIQCPSETSTNVDPIRIQVPDEKRKELRVLDALAALLVREYEKVAVMKSCDGKSIQVISVVNLNNPSPESAVTVLRRQPCRWLASLNSRTLSPKFPEKDEDAMQVVDPDTRVPKALLEHQNDPPILLNTFLLTEW